METDPRELTALLADMRRALRSEHGAAYMYRLLRPVARDPELARVLAEMEREERELIVALRELMGRLGARTRPFSVRRTAGSLLTLGAALVLGRRFALRLCLDAELTVCRWYGEYQAFLASLGYLDAAERLGSLMTTKHRHAQILETWIEHAGR
jgi:hypothetical protein